MLTETQSPALFGRQLRGYSLFTIPATSLGRAGEGVLLAVRQQLPFSISRWQTDQANSTIWLTLKPSQSQQRPLVLGVCYIPPDSHHSVQLSQRSAQVRFESLAAHIAQLNSEGHVLLAGDLNARVGAASQPWVTELGEGISAQLQNSDITVNGHGRKLMRLCEEAAMVLCTGRTPGDTPAQPSFRVSSNTEPSRLDHVLVYCGLFPAVQSSRVGAHRHESDHFPLELQLLLTVPTLPTAPPPPPAPTPTWVWDSSQRGPYAHALLSGPCQALIAGCTAAASAHQHSLSATGSAHLDLADAQFRSAIETAAQAASLRRKQPGKGRQPPTCHATLGGTPGALCYSRNCDKPSFFGPVALTFACWSAGTSLTFATAAAKLVSVRLWTSPSCSEPIHASSGRQLAFQMCCCPQSCMIQQLGTLSSAS